MLHRFELADGPERTQLRDELIQRSQQQPSYPSHNRGGWRSGPDLFTWAFEPARWLQTQVVERLREIGFETHEIVGWGVVNQKGAHHLRHCHSTMYRWSGVYYLDTGSTATVFEISQDPNQIVRVCPQVNHMVVFPVTAWHSVEPCTDAGYRVTVAFDAR